MNTQQGKTFYAFESQEGNQINYYFTDAAPELAEAEALKEAKLHFNVDNPKIKKIEGDFNGLPPQVPETYKWFVGSKDMFANQIPLDEANMTDEQKKNLHKKSAPKKAAKKVKAAKKKSRT
jgi:hypothetical protein